MNQFFPNYCIEHYIIYYVSQIFSCWWTCFFHCTAPVFTTRSFSLLSSDSESLLLVAKLTFGLLVVSTSQPICSSKSEQPYKDSSSSAGGWLLPTCLTTFLFTLKFVKVSNFFSISSLILFMFLAWLFVRTSARFPMILDCFIANFLGFYKTCAYCASIKLSRRLYFLVVWL